MSDKQNGFSLQWFCVSILQRNQFYKNIIPHFSKTSTIECRNQKIKFICHNFYNYIEKAYHTRWMTDYLLSLLYFTLWYVRDAGCTWRHLTLATLLTTHLAPVLHSDSVDQLWSWSRMAPLERRFPTLGGQFVNLKAVCLMYVVQLVTQCQWLGQAGLHGHSVQPSVVAEFSQGIQFKIVWN